MNFTCEKACYATVRGVNPASNYQAQTFWSGFKPLDDCYSKPNPPTVKWFLDICGASKLHRTFSTGAGSTVGILGSWVVCWTIMHVKSGSWATGFWLCMKHYNCLMWLETWWRINPTGIWVITGLILQSFECMVFDLLKTKIIKSWIHYNRKRQQNVTTSTSSRGTSTLLFCFPNLPSEASKPRWGGT